MSDVRLSELWQEWLALLEQPDFALLRPPVTKPTRDRFGLLERCDMRSLYSFSDGYEQKGTIGKDDGGLSVLPLEDVVTLSEWAPTWHDTEVEFAVFADYMDKSWSWGVPLGPMGRVIPTAPIYLLGASAEPEEAGADFAVVLNQLLEDARSSW